MEATVKLSEARRAQREADEYHQQRRLALMRMQGDLNRSGSRAVIASVIAIGLAVIAFVLATLT